MILNNPAAIVAFAIYAVCIGEQTEFVNASTSHYFPDSIPEYAVRLDSYTNKPVSNGRMHASGLAKIIALNLEQQVKFADLHRDLQCSSPEPDLDGNRGGWSLLKLAPPTRQSLEQVCAWMESRCQPWAACIETVQSYKNGSYDQYMDNVGKVWYGRTAIMLRVIDNKIHYDWPWGIERFKGQEEHYHNLKVSHFTLIDSIVRAVSDIGDSVFFFGGEQPFLRWNVPAPLFSFAPDLQYADMPFPWLESYGQEWAHYHRATEAGNFSDAFWTKDQTPWDQRVQKAAFFASYQGIRQLVYDSAVLRPDLFDVSFSTDGSTMQAWSPLSDEPDTKGVRTGDREPGPPLPHRNRSGFLQPLYQFNTGRGYSPHRYKYVVVPVGSGALSTSGRLAGLLAHSGAVVLLQSNSFSYHFSAHLQPWVHYVPLAFSMADIIDKVTWLRENDDKARRIAQNAANFARSYLRLEDYVCYAASSLRLLSEMENKTDALRPFSPRLIP